MAALNIAETDQLRHAVKVLETVQREGFDPNSRNERDVFLKRELKKARDSVKTVLTMKGYYPS